MRLLSSTALTLLVAAGCGDNLEPGDQPPDAGPTPDAPDAGPPPSPWRDGFYLAGIDGAGAQVNRLVRGPDGAVYAAGQFSDAAGVPTRNAARWTGFRWEPLGDGPDGWIRALAVAPDGQLWAGGVLDQGGAGTNHLVRWDGHVWTRVIGDLDGWVDDLAFLPGGGLLVVGRFEKAGTVEVDRVAIHDAQGWHPVGPSGADGEVTALTLTEDGFCVAGAFTAIGGVAAENAACWNGSAWRPLGHGLPGGIAVLARGPDQRFYAGGTLNFTVDDQGDYRAGLGVLDGETWAPFAGGIDNGFVNEVRALAWIGDTLYVGGCFQSADRAAPVPASFIARHDASGWAEVAGGLQNDVGLFLGSVEGVHDFLVDGNALWVAGLFSRAGGRPASNIARVVGNAFETVVPADARPLGVAGLLNAVALDRDGRLVAGGAFAAVGTVVARNVARLGPAGWEALGDGLNSVVRGLLVRADGTVVAAGDFSRSGDVDVPAIAQWTGTAWAPIGDPFDGVVHALAEDGDGNLYAGGEFTHAGATELAHVAKWDGQTWQPLGDGLDDRVNALAWTGTQLVAGGFFHFSGPTRTAGLAVWNGTSWAALGGGITKEFDYVSAITTTRDGGIVVGGDLAVAGASGEIKDLALWDGDAWQPLGEPLRGQNDFTLVSALAPYRDGVIVGGIFNRIGLTDVRFIGWWDGNQWHALGEGLADLPEDVAVSGDTVWVGGGFVEAGGKVSSGLAVWDFPSP